MDIYYFYKNLTEQMSKFNTKLRQIQILHVVTCEYSVLKIISGLSKQELK